MVLPILALLLATSLPQTSVANTCDYFTQGFNPTIDATTYPPDISFCIVDLKYKKNNLKICEFGQGVVSGFYGHQRLYGANKIWEGLWRFLGGLNVPIFYIKTEGKVQGINATTLCKTAGFCTPASIQDLKDDTLFQEFMQKKNAVPTRLCDVAGVIFAKKPRTTFSPYPRLKQSYPGIIALDYATRHIVLNKLKTHLLFLNDPELERFRPKCCIVPAKYSPGMAQKIIKSASAQHYVIKPISDYKGAGIIFCAQKELEYTLKTILQPEQTDNMLRGEEYNYWINYEKPYLLVESLESSQPITLMGKEYDATMRVAFGAAYDQGNIVINFFGAYWKLPVRAISDTASLSDRYKSHIAPKIRCSEKVDPQTYRQVTTILKKVLPKIYLKMIAACHDQDFLPSVQRILDTGSTCHPSETHRS